MKTNVAHYIGFHPISNTYKCNLYYLNSYGTLPNPISTATIAIIIFK